MSARALKLAEANQRAAADPETSVFVTANAGSGKTKVLIDRIARLLLAGSKPSAFLCITYTKAAAAEMQRRLFERLGAWCVAADEKLRVELEALGAGSASLGRARALFAQALETPGGLRIQTIHAFCERLLARFPIEARVAPGFDVADETRAAALLARARAEAALAADAPARAFERFAARLSGDDLDSLFDRLANRRAEFHRFATRCRGGVFAEAEIRNRHGVRQDAEALLREFFERRDWSGLQAAAAALAESSKQDQDAAARLRQVLQRVERRAAAREIFEACREFAFTSNGALYKKFATAAAAKANPWIEPLLRGFAEACLGVREKLNSIERAEDAAAALQLALKLDEAYEAAKRSAGALDFDDLIEHALALLHRAEAAPWVLYKLDGGIDHILIDEGQDTSPAQWDVIAPLQDEFFAGAGARASLRTIFAVGDPKQSIYAFQGADPRRFLGEAQRLSKRARGAGARFKAPTLETSFRSTPEVLAVVDATMADKELAAATPGKHDETRHLAAREKQRGCVEVWPLLRRPPIAPAVAWDAPMDVETGASVQALLARHVARRIKEMIAGREAVWDGGRLRPMCAGDVMALVRTRGALFRELITAFKREGLPVAGADRMVLRDELAVQDCLALMRVALDPTDDLALACVFKGPWCDLGDDDNDLFPLAYGRARGQPLHSRLLAEGNPKYAHARALVAELTARAGDSAFSFLSWALETPHVGGATGWSRVFSRLGPEARDPLEELLQRALRTPAQSAGSLQRFLSDIEGDAGQVKRELEAETGAIRVMTVHGAKGLEAPVVVLPDTTAPAPERPDDGLIFDDVKGPFISFRSSDDDAAVREARASFEAHMLGEHWRLLYVAMTRARDRLIVCGAQHGNSKAGEAEESWRSAVEAALRRLEAAPIETPCGEGLRHGACLCADRGSPALAGANVELPPWARAAAQAAASPRATAPSRLHRIDPALFSPSGDGQRRFRRGSLIHQLLQRLPEVAPERRHSAATAWLARQGAQAEEAEVLTREALAVIADARFDAVFGPNSRAEAPIAGMFEGRAVRGIVDRLVVDNDRVIVLDFKTDRPAPTEVARAPDAYVTQLALYREVLRQIFPEKPVDCALIWTEAPHLMALPQSRLDEALQMLRRA